MSELWFVFIAGCVKELRKNIQSTIILHLIIFCTYSYFFHMNIVHIISSQNIPIINNILYQLSTAQHLNENCTLTIVCRNARLNVIHEQITNEIIQLNTPRFVLLYLFVHLYVKYICWGCWTVAYLWEGSIEFEPLHEILNKFSNVKSVIHF